MLSPFPPSSSRPGHGEVHLTLLPPGTPSFGTLTYTYPLKLLPSKPHTLVPPLSSSSSFGSTGTITTATTATTDTTSSNRAALEEASDAATTTTAAAQPAELTNPNKATIQRPPSNVPLLFLLTYGGGLLAGDEISLDMKLDAGTRLTITTQGSTKVYRPPNTGDDISISMSTLSGRPPPPPSPPPPITRQDLVVKISAGAALWLAPDPVQPFSGSFYAQSQVFEVERGGSLGMVDWVSEGRTSRGEKWGFESWRGRNEVWSVTTAPAADDGSAGTIQDDAGMKKTKTKTKKTLLVRDAVILEGNDLPAKMDGMGIFGTILLRGPLFKSLGAFFTKEFTAMPRVGGRNWDHDQEEEEGEAKRKSFSSFETEKDWRKRRLDSEKKGRVLWTACNVRGVYVIKFSAREVEGARWWLGDMLRREGMVGREFGEGGLMFVR